MNSPTCPLSTAITSRQAGYIDSIRRIIAGNLSGANSTYSGYQQLDGYDQLAIAKALGISTTEINQILQKAVVGISSANVTTDTIPQPAMQQIVSAERMTTGSQLSAPTTMEIPNSNPPINPMGVLVVIVAGAFLLK